MIIKWLLNGLFHECCDVIITPQMVVIRFPFNDGRYLKYYDDQKSRNVIITESNNLEMTVSEKSRWHVVING